PLVRCRGGAATVGCVPAPPERRGPSPAAPARRTAPLHRAGSLRQAGEDREGELLMRAVLLRSSVVLAFGLVTMAGGSSHAGPPATNSFDPLPAKHQPKATARAIVRGGPGAATRLAISHIEVTQGVQDEQQSVPIRAGRAAYVRVLFNVTAGGATVALGGT